MVGKLPNIASLNLHERLRGGQAQIYVGPLLCPRTMLSTLISIFNICSQLSSRYYFHFCLTGEDVDIQKELGKDL